MIASSSFTTRKNHNKFRLFSRCFNLSERKCLSDGFYLDFFGIYRKLFAIIAFTSSLPRTLYPLLLSTPA